MVHFGDFKDIKVPALVQQLQQSSLRKIKKLQILLMLTNQDPILDFCKCWCCYGNCSFIFYSNQQFMAGADVTDDEKIYTR